MIYMRDGDTPIPTIQSYEISDVNETTPKNCSCTLAPHPSVPQVPHSVYPITTCTPQLRSHYRLLVPQRQDLTRTACSSSLPTPTSRDGTQPLLPCKLTVMQSSVLSGLIFTTRSIRTAHPSVRRTWTSTPSPPLPSPPLQAHRHVDQYLLEPQPELLGETLASHPGRMQAAFKRQVQGQDVRGRYAGRVVVPEELYAHLYSSPERGGGDGSEQVSVGRGEEDGKSRVILEERYADLHPPNGRQGKAGAGEWGQAIVGRGGCLPTTAGCASLQVHICRLCLYMQAVPTGAHMQVPGSSAGHPLSAGPRMDADEGTAPLAHTAQSEHTSGRLHSPCLLCAPQRMPSDTRPNRHPHSPCLRCAPPRMPPDACPPRASARRTATGCAP